MTDGRIIDYAQVDWEAGAPRSIFFDDIYFSGGGAEETEHVFLKGNDLQRRFAEAMRFTIGELGFGSGLNFLSAVALWRGVRRPGAQLNFLSFEKFPLHPDDLRRAGRAWPQFGAEMAALAEVLPPPLRGLHQIGWSDGVTLTLGLGDARELLELCEAEVDAWFLDGFSPAKNPEMWSEAVLRQVARVSTKGATAATFTVAGDVRRGLEAAGFSVEKRPGYGRKREMLTARIDAPDKTSKRAPWFSFALKKPPAPGETVAIIGGGVAGASVAEAAAAAGLEAVIIDPKGLAAGASGNPAGLIMPRLDLGDTAASRFFAAAYLHTLRTIARLERETGERFFDPCGVRIPSRTAEDSQRAETLIAAGLLPPDFVCSREGDLFFPQGGVVDPSAFVRALARSARVVTASASELTASEKGVCVLLDRGDVIAAGAVIIANGAEALVFAEARTLPLSRVAGQIDHFRNAAEIATAYAFGAYAAPAPDGGVVIGATYERLAAGDRARPSNAATQSNIDAVGAALPHLAGLLNPYDSVPRASVRCQTPDRLPIAGPAPDIHFYGAHYDDLRFGKSRDYPQGQVAAQLYLLTGLGSRGLVTAPLCAAMILAEISGAPSPVGYDVAEALHPARFFIRDLKRAVRRRRN
jgi:tRNA 5-methylaminomethyl-2-thiouridine biosynthesis bifunctional protein